MACQMAFNVKRQRMEERLRECQVIGAACPPIAWTISNRLAEFAPFVLKWYFRCVQFPGAQAKAALFVMPVGIGFFFLVSLMTFDCHLHRYVVRNRQRNMSLFACQKNISPLWHLKQFLEEHTFFGAMQAGGNDRQRQLPHGSFWVWIHASEHHCSRRPAD